MIPYPIPSLTGVTVLVTRPEPNAQALCDRIASVGGAAISFPSIAISAVLAQAPAGEFDWWIFISANAVAYGLPHLKPSASTRVAAIGKATAAALTAHQIGIDAVPEKGSTSEDLLAHPAFADVAGKHVLIVKGEGGREQLFEALTARGAHVATYDVYKRCLPIVNADALAELERLWSSDGIDIVTVTSVETLRNLQTLLPEESRKRLAMTPFVAPSQRVIDAARDLGLEGDGCLAKDADDDAIVGAIAAWHARAR